MSHNTGFSMSSPRATEPFMVRDDILLYAGIPRVPIAELGSLLSRGSGRVVRNGTRSKGWFQAQCAHYGLPTHDTLATLRLHLESSLKMFRERMQEKANQLEKERLNTQLKPRRTLKYPATKAPPKSAFPRLAEASLATVSSGPSTSLDPIVTHRNNSQIRVEQPVLDFVPVCASPPSLAPRSKPTHRESKPQNFGGLKHCLKFPEPSSSGTDTDTESDPLDNSFSSSEVPVTFPPPGISSPLFHPNPIRRGSCPQLSNDVVSGRWNLHVTCSTMVSPPEPWRTASSKWLRGDMDVHLSQNRRSLTAEFTLFGMDGVIKSRKFEPRGEGVCAWVKFVAQMPMEAAVQSDGTSLGKHYALGPSELQYGYLRFYGEGRIRGMLRCRRYGRLEFEGVRIGQPRPPVVSWSDFV